MIGSIQISVLCGEERGGWINPGLAMSLLAWSHDPKRTRAIEVVPAHGFHTSQEARNYVTDRFLRSSHGWLLLVDNDTRPERDGCCINLPAMADLNRPIVAAAIPVLNHGQLYVNCYFEHGDTYRTPILEDFRKAAENGLVACDAVGSGAVLLRRDVLEQLAAAGASTVAIAECPYLPNLLGATVPVWLRPRDAFGRTQIGEDLYLCRRAKRLGFSVHSSLEHLCGHLHTVDQGMIPEIQTGREPEWAAADYGLTDPIPAITPWAITPGMAARLRAAVAAVPSGQTVMELGSGISTCVLASAGARLISVEHDEEYARALGNLNGWPTPLVKPLENGWYNDRGLPGLKSQIGLLFVDGPPGDTAPLARYPALPRLHEHLAPGATIILDDAHRPDEREILDRWLREFPVRLEAVETFEHGRQMAILKWAA